jgi:hypothetical protein
LVPISSQDNSLGSGIKEISVNVPTAPVTNDDYFYTGQTRRNTPLAAVTWKPAGASTPEVRFYPFLVLVHLFLLLWLLSPPFIPFISTNDCLLQNHQIRVYFITTSNTLGEVAYSGGRWNSGGGLGFPVQADSNVLYALKAGDILVVGYVSGEGSLSEAYYNISSSSGWKGYVL